MNWTIKDGYSFKDMVQASIDILDTHKQFNES